MEITIQDRPRFYWHSDCKGSEMLDVKGCGMLLVTERSECSLSVKCGICGELGIIPEGSPVDSPFFSELVDK